jgi:hypothetical protein
MRVVSELIQSHHISRAEFPELKKETQQAFRNIKDAIIRLTEKHFVDRFLNDDVSSIRPVLTIFMNLLIGNPYMKRILVTVKKVELLSEKQHVQPQSLFPAIVPVEEYPPQAQLNTITS